MPYAVESAFSAFRRFPVLSGAFLRFPALFGRFPVLSGAFWRCLTTRIQWRKANIGRSWVLSLAPEIRGAYREVKDSDLAAASVTR